MNAMDKMDNQELISALAAALPRYSRRLGTVPFEHGRLGQMMQALEDAFPGSSADRTGSRPPARRHCSVSPTSNSETMKGEPSCVPKS